MARARPFNLTAQINLRGPANIRSVVSNIRRQLGSVSANVNVNVSTAAANSINRLNTRLRTLNTTLATSRNNINDVTAAINALSAAMRGLPTTPPAIVPPNLPTTTRQIQQARSEMEEFGRQAGLAIRRFAAFSVVTTAIYAATTAVRQGLTAFVEFDKEMVRLQQVTGESATSLGGLAKEITTLSTSLGASSASLMTVATTLAQAGLTAKDTQKALKAIALSSLAPSFDDMNSTVEGSIALMRQFNISAGDLESALGSVNAVAARFAVEASDIIAAIQRTGGVFASASKGVSEGTDALNEFVAVFTSVRQTTRESAETIATGLRTIFTRIQRGGTIEALKEFGITLTDAEGKFVGAYKAIQLLSEGLNSIDPRDLKFSQIVEELGGFRQIGKVIPLIQQFATAQQALAVAQKGAGSLAADAATAQLSLANQLSKVREEFLALFREIGGSDSFQMMAKAALSIASALIKVADAAKNVLPIIGTIMAVRGLQGIGQFATGFGTGIRRRGATGGRMGYAGGDMVDVALMPGEAVLYPEQAKRVGTAKLRKMNYADKRMAKGGVAQVPGSGRSDSFYTQLPAGSFVIRKDATAALGMNRISEIASGRQKFAMGGMPKARGVKGARGARSKFKELTEQEIAKLSTADLIKYAKAQARDIFSTGGAGLVTRTDFIPVSQSRITPELESSLTTYLGKKGFWKEKISPFGKPDQPKINKARTKLSRESALKAQQSRVSDEVAARAQEWGSIRTGSSIDNYLMSALKEPILSDYRTVRSGGQLAKPFHSTRLRQSVNKALDKFDDFDYSAGNIDKLVSGMAAKRFGLGGKLAVTDFDMTAAISKQQETPSLSGFRNPKLAVPDIMGASPTGIIKLLKQYGATGVLTARSGGPKGEMRTALGSFFKQNGIMVPSSRLITLGDQIGELSTAEKKARALHSMVKKYGSLDFFDDDPRNIDAAKMVRGVNAKRVKLRRGFGGDVQKFAKGRGVQYHTSHLGSTKTPKREFVTGKGTRVVGRALDNYTIALKDSFNLGLREGVGSGISPKKLLNFLQKTPTETLFSTQMFGTKAGSGSKRGRGGYGYLSGVDKKTRQLLQAEFQKIAPSVRESMIKSLSEKINSGLLPPKGKNVIHDNDLDFLKTIFKNELKHASPALKKAFSRVNEYRAYRKDNPDLSPDFFSGRSLVTRRLPRSSNYTAATGGLIQKLMAGEFVKDNTVQLITRYAHTNPEIKSNPSLQEALLDTVANRNKGSITHRQLAEQLATAIRDKKLTPTLASKILSGQTSAIPVGPGGKTVIQALSLEAIKPGSQTAYSRNIGGKDVEIVRGSPTPELSAKLTRDLTQGIRIGVAKFIRTALTHYGSLDPNNKQELINQGVKFDSKGRAIPTPSQVQAAMSHGNINNAIGPMFEQGIIGLGAKAGPRRPGKAAPIDTNQVGKVVASIMTGGARLSPNYPTEIRASEAKTIPSDTIPNIKKRGLVHQILRYFKLPRFASGGEVPIMAERGEYVINKHAAQSIGYNNLHKMNKYHSGGVVGSKPQKFAVGGMPSAIGGALSRILAGLTDSIRRFTTTIARVPRGGGWLGGSPIPGMPATGTGSRAGARGRTPGVVPDDNRRQSGAQSAAFALSMAIPVITEMMSSRNEPVTAQAAGSQAFTSGVGGAAGAGLAIASMGGKLGAAGGIAAFGVGMVKAFADAENAVREFNIKLKTDDLNEALEKTSKSLDKFANNMGDVAIRGKAIADVLSTIGKAEDVQKASEKPLVGLFNLFDSGVGAFERSVVLFNNGIFEYLRTLDFFAGGPEAAKANTAISFAKSIPKLSRERAGQFSGAADASSRLMETELRRTGSLDALKANAAQFDKLSQSLALADAQVQEEIMTVKNNTRLSDIDKKATIDNIVATNAENKVLELQTRVLRAKAIEDLNKAANRTSFSLERIFSSLEQNVNAASYAVEKLGQSSELVAASLSGQARIGKTNIDAINVLQNPRGYSAQQNRSAANLGGSTFGPALSDSMRGLLEFGPRLEDVIMSTINETVANTPREELNNEMIAARIGTAVNRSLDDLGLPPDLTNKLSAEVGKTLEEMRKEGEDKVDFSQLMERIPALARTLESAKRAQEAAIQALEHWQATLNKYSDAFNAILALQIQNNERVRESSDRLFQAQMDLAKTFGGQTDLRKVINNFNAGIASMSGGLTSVGDITANIQRLEQLRQQQQALQSDAANRGQGGVDAFMLMTDQLNNTNLKLRENVAALEKMSQSTELASAAMSRIAELQQKQQAGIGIIEKMVTSTPKDIATFSRALSRLQVNMQGGAIRGSTSGGRSEVLEAFNMIAPLLGEKQNAMRANVLESMLAEINAPITPFFRNILDSLRNPKADPQMNDAIRIYNLSLAQQTAAATALNKLNDITIKSTSENAAKMIVDGITGATLNFEQTQLKGIRDGINKLVGLVAGRGGAPAVGLASGGVVYADQGMFVPRGTDTVPAMLTPGEFVVNKAATQKNLPLLKSINSGRGAKGYSRGGVAYLAGGGMVYSLYNQSADLIAAGDTRPADVLETKGTYLSLEDPEFKKIADTLKVKGSAYDTATAIRPVAYASTASASSIGGTLAGLRVFNTLETQIADANATLNSMNIISRPAVVAPKDIDSSREMGISQRASSTARSATIRLDLLKNSIAQSFENIKEQKLKFSDSIDAKNIIDSYKAEYPKILAGLLDYKIGTDHIVDDQGFKIFNLSQMEKDLPTLKPRVHGDIKISGLADYAKEFYGPTTTDAINSRLQFHQNPIGFAQYSDPLGLVGESVFDVKSGIENIGVFESITGEGTKLGARIYSEADISRLSGATISNVLLQNVQRAAVFKEKIKNSLKNLDNEEIIESQKNILFDKLQATLDGLYNNKLFSATILPEDIGGTGIGLNIPKEPFTLYNIQDQAIWNDFITTASKKIDGSYSKNIATNGYRIESVDNTTQLIGGMKKFPWTTKEFEAHQGIENALRADFQAQNKIIKEATEQTYTKNNMNFNYRKVKGPYYNSATKGFQDKDENFIVIPLGGNTPSVNNPFGEAALENTDFAIFDDEAMLDAKIVALLKKIQRDPKTLAFRSETIKNIPLMGDYDALTKNNAFDIPSAGVRDIAFPNFVKAYQDQLGKAGMAGVKANVPGVVDANAQRIDDVNTYFDTLNTDKNLKKISGQTVRNSDVSGIASSLRLRLFDIGKSNMLPQYSQYLSAMASNLGRDPRFVKIKKFGPRGKEETYKEINEKAAKLYARLLVSGEFFSALASRNVGSLAQFLGKNPLEENPNGQGVVDSYINSILGKSKDRMSSIISQSAFDKVLGQKTDALKDAMADPAAIMEMADIDQDTGEIKGWKKVDATAAPDKTVAQIASLALNPYNFFDPNSRSNLISQGVINPFEKQLAKYNSSRVKPKDLIKQTSNILGNLTTLKDYFSGYHDKIMSYQPGPNELDAIKAGAQTNPGNPTLGIRNSVKQLLMDTGLLKMEFDDQYAKASASYSELTGGDNKLIGLNFGTPLPNQNLLIDLLIKRLKVVADRQNPAAPPAAGAAPAAGAGAAPAAAGAAAGGAPVQLAKGGVVYASTGKLINFQPRGTDTVPAMLTPGEFVVNAKSTKQNLGLLQSLNSGAKGYQRGGVVYLDDGGTVPSTSTSSSTSSSSMGESYQLTVSQDARNFLTALQQSIGEQGFGSYVSRLEKLATSFPDRIEVKIVPPDTPIQVNITGAAALEELGKMDSGMSKNIMKQVSNEIAQIWRDSGGQLGSRPG